MFEYIFGLLTGALVTFVVMYVANSELSHVVNLNSKSFDYTLTE
jgi:hypothetical protein